MSPVGCEFFSLSIVPSKFIHVLVSLLGIKSDFYGVDTPNFVYLFTL